MHLNKRSQRRFLIVAAALIFSLGVSGISYAYFAAQISAAQAQGSRNMSVGTWTLPSASETGERFSFNNNAQNIIGWTLSGSGSYASSYITMYESSYYTNNTGNIFGREGIKTIAATAVIAKSGTFNFNRNVTMTMTAVLSDGSLSTSAATSVTTAITSSQKTVTYNMTVPLGEYVTGLRYTYSDDSYGWSWLNINLYSISVSYVYYTTGSTNDNLNPALSFSKYVNAMPAYNATNATQVGDMINYHNTLDATWLNVFNTSTDTTISSARTKYNQIRQYYASTYPL